VVRQVVELVEIAAHISGDTYTIFLPSAIGSGNPVIIKNLASGTIVVSGINTDTIDGILTKELTSYGSLTIIDAAIGKWEII